MSALLWLHGISTAQLIEPGMADSLYAPYDFIDLRKNRIDAEGVQNLHPFFKKLDLLAKGENRQVRIVHIGDSHIQADYFSGTTRVLLQKSFGNAGRGFVFPYRTAGTNGPPDYGLQSKGEWKNNRASAIGTEGNCGLNGYGLYTTDSAASLKMYPSNENLDYSFDRVRLFYFDSPSSFSWASADTLNAPYLPGDEQAFDRGNSTLFYDFPQDSFNFQLVKDHAGQYFAEFYGASLEKNRAGILYHSAGQNGAFVQNFLNSPYFMHQLNSLDADLVILSLGTNNAYSRNNKMCASCFTDAYRKLIKQVKNASPKASILLTTPGDFFIKRRYHCRDIEKVVEAIYELAREQDCAVWDFNRLMGGSYAIRQWQAAGLARNDLIHFSEKGYRLQGFLFYEALTDAYQHWRETH